LHIVVVVLTFKCQFATFESISQYCNNRTRKSQTALYLMLKPLIISTSVI